MIKFLFVRNICPLLFIIVFCHKVLISSAKNLKMHCYGNVMKVSTDVLFNDHDLDIDICGVEGVEPIS